MKEKKMNVLNGIGKPRIIDSIDVTATKTISDALGLQVTLSSSASGLVGKYLKTKNTAGDDIYGKVESVDGNSVTVDAWYDGIHSASQTPDTGISLYVLGTVYDLPYAQFLDEGISEDVRFKKRKQYGVIKKNVKGFYYKADMSYDKIATKELYDTVITLLNLKDSFIWIPRRDQPLAAYSVNFAEGFEMKFRQKAFHQGNQGLTLALTGAIRLDSVSLPTISG